MITVLYEDADLLVIEKPTGISSQADGTADSVPVQLAQQGYPVKPVHRLDRQTGGVMVYARTDRGAAALSALVSDHHRFHKEYLAVVGGTPVPPEGRMEDLLYHDPKTNKSFIVRRERRGVRRAVLHYRTLETVDSRSLVAVQLETGRTHQIRVQFASRQLPLAGDTRYGGERGVPLCLWSCRLAFPHPFTGRTVCADSLPDCQAFPWDRFRMPAY